MRVRIAQCLCSDKRHAIGGFVLNDPSIPDADVLTMLRQMVALNLAGRGDELPGATVKSIRPWCSLCGAPAEGWIYEVRTSREYPDWEAAQAHMREMEMDQALTQALAHASGRSFDAQRQRRN